MGDGVLSWAPDGGAPARHPLLIQRLQVEFNPDEPSFRLVEADQPPELYTGLLRSLGADPRVVEELNSETKDSHPHPLGGVATETFLKKAAVALHAQGEFLGVREAPPAGRFPCIVRDPVVFLRTRALGFAAAIEAIRSDLREGGEIPESLAALVGVHAELGDDTGVVDPFEQGDEAEDVFLTKEANREQLEIARRLSRYGAVLVQGPPGTGKTHTIANLIGHLLANGKSVLVTSHATKALRVLREKVVSDLQPLCVAILEGDGAGNQQLHDSVVEIGRRLSASSADQLEREAAALRAQRQETLGAIAEARQKLMDVVRAEYSALPIGGTDFTPQEAARRIHEGESIDSWIPGKVAEGSPLPLSAADCRDLYATNGTLPEGDLREIEGTLPDPGELPAPVAFEQGVHERQHLMRLAEDSGDLWRDQARTVPALRAFAKRALAAFEGLPDATGWYREAFAAAMRSGEDAEPWSRFLAELDQWAAALRARHLAIRNYAVSLHNESDFATLLRATDEIVEKLRAGKPLRRRFGRLPKAWEQLIQGASVLGNEPASLDHFEALRDVLLPAVMLDGLRPRWDVLMAPFGEPSPAIGTGAEQAEEWAAQLRHAVLERPALVGALTREAWALGLDMARFLPKGPRSADWWAEAAREALHRLPGVIDAEAARVHLTTMDQSHAALVQRLTTLPGHTDGRRPAGQLLSAVQSRSPSAYAEAYERLSSLWERRALAARRSELLGRLSPVAHDWAEAIHARSAPHDATDPPGDPVRAWEWKQLAQALDTRLEQSAPELIGRVEALRRHLREQTTEMIDRLAWAAQARKTGPEARQALSGYVEFMKKIGKGGGKRAPRLRQAAREQMSKASRAVPVWIAPLSRVAEAFDARTHRFDVVVLDEASQSDALGLIAWYLGKQVIVVGDDQQVTPDAVGERVDDMTSMIDAHLAQIPNRELYDGQASVYQLASTAFRGVVRLREHFRCVPDIISFSNALSYSGDIIPLRDPASSPVGPAVVPHRVVVEVMERRDINEAEAHHIAALLVACLEQREYKDLTFGVISLLGNEQSPRIEQILRSRIPASVFHERRILCGTPPHFQGDERHVLFLSMVDSPPEDAPLALRPDPGERFKKRYNVATSRARDQLWVVHSLDRRRDLKPGDLRLRLLEWADDPGAGAREKQGVIGRAESPFEQEVLSRLIDAGYRVHPQYKVGAYRIDIVVEGERQARLAVECDGAQFHSTPEQIRSDLDRQALLERMGWRFHRIRSSEYYRSPDRAMGALFDRLASCTSH